MTMTRLPPAGGPTEDLARAAVERGVGELLGRQLADGSWPRPRPAGTGGIAEGLLIGQAMGGARPDHVISKIAQLKALQLPAGGWPASSGGEPGLAASVKAYAALRLAGEPADAYQLALAAAWIRGAGGIPGAGEQARLWLTIAGMLPCPNRPFLPPELGYLPAPVSPGKSQWRIANCISADRVPAGWISAEWAPAEWFAAEFGCPESTASQAESARALALAPLAVIQAISSRRPAFCDLGELIPGPSERGSRFPAAARTDGTRPGGAGPEVTGLSGTVIGDAGSDGAGFAGLAGKGAAGTVTAGFLGLRRRAGTRELAAKAGQVLADGSLGVLAARSARSARLAALRHCAERIAAAQDNDGSWGQSPLVSALSLAALTELGYGPGHRVVGAGLRWFGLDVTPTEDREDETGGGPVPGLGRTGREVAITSLAVRALTDAGLPPGHPALTRADGWLGCHSARCVKGGPGNRAFASGVSRAGTFTSRPVAATSSAGRGWPTAAAAAGAVAVLSVAGESASPAARHGVVWLLRAQRADGAWPGPDSRGDEVSTGLAIRALVEAGVGPGKRPVRSAVRWLADRQRPDGAWEGGIASAAATAALLVAGGPGESAERGARWLADQICPDHAPAGADSALAVPVDVLCYQLSALGLFLSARAGGDGVIRR